MLSRHQRMDGVETCRFPFLSNVMPNFRVHPGRVSVHRYDHCSTIESFRARVENAQQLFLRGLMFTHSSEIQMWCDEQVQLEEATSSSAVVLFKWRLHRHYCSSVDTCCRPFFWKIDSVIHAFCVARSAWISGPRTSTLTSHHR